MSRLPPALVMALGLFGLLVVFGPWAAPVARAGGYGPFDWGEGLRSIGKKLDGRKLQARSDVDALMFEARVLRLERDEKVRQARLKKKPAADIRRLQKAKPAKARLSAYAYWVELGALDAKVLLHLLDERLTSAEVHVLFEPSQRAAAGELLDLMQSKYGAPKAHRGAATPDAPAVDVFDAGDTEIEAFQQPAVGSRAGFLRIMYRSKDRAEVVTHYLDDLAARLKAIELARNPPGPTAEERELHRKSALMQNL